MFRHMVKLIWNRKKSNSLIITEIAIAFIVVFVLGTISIRFYTLYQLPLGFDYQDRWQIRLIFNEWDEKESRESVKHLVNAIKQQPEVDAVFLLNNPVFQDWNWTSSYEKDGRNVVFMGNYIDDSAVNAMGLKLVQGRWFGEQDNAQNYQPVLVSQSFVDQVYPNENPLGKNLGDPDSPDDNIRIVGVFESFRQLGELREPSAYLFKRYNVEDTANTRAMSHIQIKVKAGTSVAFENTLVNLMKGIEPAWDYAVKPWEQLRISHLKSTLTPLVIFAVIGVFLIIMVAMGLFGVLWQNVTRRTQEIGLRRALGATAINIHVQIITELLIITLLGILIALVLLIQIPLLGVLHQLTWALFWQGFVLAGLFMLLLSGLCAFYPGKVATEYQPATALHYE